MKALKSRLKNKPVEVAMLGFGAWGVVSSTRHLATSWKNDDKLERAANLAGLVAALLGLMVGIRKFRREVSS